VVSVFPQIEGLLGFEFVLRLQISRFGFVVRMKFRFGDEWNWIGDCKLVLSFRQIYISRLLSLFS
jgi:hypothetical protein